MAALAARMVVAAIVLREVPGPRIRSLVVPAMAGVPLPGVRVTPVARSRDTEADIIREARLTAPPLSAQQLLEHTEPTGTTTTTTAAVTTTRTASISVRTSIHTSIDPAISRSGAGSQRWRGAKHDLRTTLRLAAGSMSWKSAAARCPAGLRTSAGGLTSATPYRCGTSKAADRVVSVAEHEHGHEGHRQQPQENDSALNKPFPTHGLNVAPAHPEKSSNPDLVRETSFTTWRSPRRTAMDR